MLSHSTEETIREGAKLADRIRKGGVICLFGDLGSGKTTLTKGIAQSLGIEKFSVKSPTYTYIREYRTEKHRIYHIDLYRLETIDELLWNEIAELFENKSNILIIEWADRMKSRLTDECIQVSMKYIDENSREIDFFANPSQI